MKLETGFCIKKLAFVFCILFIFFWSAAPVFSYPVKITDAEGNNITIKKKPSQVVSLVPSITEMIFKLGAGDSVKALTYHDTWPPETSEKQIVGGFLSPSLNRIEKMQPDIIFLAGNHKEIRKRFNHGKCRLIDIETDSIADSYKDILLLGKIFNREKTAVSIVDEIEKELQTISQKTAKLPVSERRRVIRLMGRDTVMTPGDDSFQNELIRAAGGIPPELNKKGNIVTITKAEWMKFNPQVIYGCGGDRKAAENFFSLPGWKDVEAVKNGRIFYFPCELTCRASTHTGYFVSWLSSRIYPDVFSKKENQVLKEKIFSSRDLKIDLDYIKHARIAYSNIYDFINKTLIVDFKKPLSIVSTLEGQRDRIESVGNHYSSPPCWGMEHGRGLKDIRSRVFQTIGKSEGTSSFLFTGADMDNLSIKQKHFKDMEVYALVTAGVKSNAVRMSKDHGNYYEPGTINVIIMTNMMLTNRAMTRAIIAATEAKTAALMDMDIRSSYSSLHHQATGTGTDNIIVVQGNGIRIDSAGGHCKMGELIANAVYDGVKEAIYKQNGVVVDRNIFQRLKERKISISDFVSEMNCECSTNQKSDLAGAVEEILLDSRYTGFLESSLALSDDYEKGLLTDLSTYKLWCNTIVEEIAGKKIKGMTDLVGRNDLPVVLKMALNTILNGAYYITE
jgi:iron complex transport system substrate-binding protein